MKEDVQLKSSIGVVGAGIQGVCISLCLIKKGFKVDEFLNNLENSFTTPEIKVPCSEELKFKIVDKIISKLNQKYNPAELLLIDGIRVTNDYGWFLIRASNTENALVVRAEGKTKNFRNLLVDEVKALSLIHI